MFDKNTLTTIFYCDSILKTHFQLSRATIDKLQLSCPRQDFKTHPYGLRIDNQKVN